MRRAKSTLWHKTTRVDAKQSTIKKNVKKKKKKNFSTFDFIYLKK